MDKIMQEIEKEAWNLFQSHEIQACNYLCWVYNILGIELERCERLNLHKDYEHDVWLLDKEYLGGRSNV